MLFINDKRKKGWDSHSNFVLAFSYHSSAIFYFECLISEMYYLHDITTVFCNWAILLYIEINKIFTWLELKLICTVIHFIQGFFQLHVHVSVNLRFFLKSEFLCCHLESFKILLNNNRKICSSHSAYTICICCWFREIVFFSCVRELDTPLLKP